MATDLAPETEVKTLNVRHAGNAGDVIYALSGLRELWRKTGHKINLYLSVNRPAFYYEGAVHPVFDESGRNNVMLNHYMVKLLTPLLQAQDYIEDVYVWQGEKIHFDMDKIRDLNQAIGMPNGCIKRWYSYVFPDMVGDYSQPCITLPESLPSKQIDKYGDYILVNRTERYQNYKISYLFLKNYPKVIFAGTKREYDLFKMQAPHAHHLTVDSGLELAQWISRAKVFIGNQSMCYAIAEQMKSVRILEVCSYAPNVIPSGANGYDFYNQDSLEYFVETLWKREKV